MKSVLLPVVVLTIAACAGQPSSPPPPAVTSTATATSGKTITVSGDDIDEKRIADAKKRGYTLVNTNGQTLYCRTDFKTGSHLVKQTTCLTSEELDALHDQTRQGMQSLRPNAPKAGT